MDHTIKCSSTSSHHRIKHHKKSLLAASTGEKLAPDLEMKIGLRQREMVVLTEGWRDGWREKEDSSRHGCSLEPEVAGHRCTFLADGREGQGGPRRRRRRRRRRPWTPLPVRSGAHRPWDPEPATTIIDASPPTESGGGEAERERDSRSYPLVTAHSPPLIRS